MIPRPSLASKTPLKPQLTHTHTHTCQHKNKYISQGGKNAGRTQSTKSLSATQNQCEKESLQVGAGFSLNLNNTFAASPPDYQNEWKVLLR